MSRGEVAPDADTAGGSTIDQQPSEHEPAHNADARRKRIQEATTILATRLADAQSGVVKPDRWIGAVAERLTGEHAEAGHRLLAEHPDLTPVALADLLDRKPGDADEQRERQRQAEEETRQLLMRDKLTTTDAERARVAGDISRIRRSIRQPHRQDESA